MDFDLLKNEIINRFSYLDNELLFCLVFGSVATDSHTAASDIDLMFVTKNPLQNCQKRQILKAYFLLHEYFNFKPSTTFPAEIISRQDLKQGISGKGFQLIKDSLVIQPIHDEGWNELNSFRFYLCILANQTQFIFGNEKQYDYYKQEALSTLIAIVIIAADLKNFTIRQLAALLIGTGKYYLGFKTNQASVQYLDRNLPDVFKTWKEENVVAKKEDVWVIKQEQYFTKIKNNLIQVNAP